MDVLRGGFRERPRRRLPKVRPDGRVRRTPVWSGNNTVPPGDKPGLVLKRVPLAKVDRSI